MSGHRTQPGDRNERQPSLFECLRLALAEERGLLIVALYELSQTDLARLVEAAQLIDSEGVEILDLITQEASP